MKKIISAIAALSVCAAMLTGCGGGGSTAELQNETTTAPVVTTTAVNVVFDNDEASEETAETKGKTEEASETKKEEETTAATEPEDSADEKPEFDSLDEFAQYDLSSLSYEKVKAEDSHTYDFVKALEGAEGFYLDVETTDGTISMTMALQGKNISMDYIDDTGTRVLVLITDYVMYMFDPSTMVCYYFEVDESIFDEYNTDELLSQIDIDESKLAKAEKVESCKVNIDGTDYTFEYSDGSGFLYDVNGKMYAIVSNDSSLDMNVLIIHEFSANVPAGTFDIPDGYEMMDFSALFSLGE